MSVRPEGSPFIGGGLVLVMVMGLLGLPALAALVALAVVFLLKFFGDPQREGPRGDGLLISPADGRVVEVGDGHLAIFMSLFDCHVNRAPVDGEVVGITHTPGGYRPANSPQAKENERSTITFSTPKGEVKMSQVAGMVARRILCWVKPGQRVKQGEKVGMILFGSRVEIEVPPQSWRFLVPPGGKVKAGETIVAREVSN